MKFTEFDVSMKNHAFRIYPIGDTHITLRGFNESRAKAYIQQIANDPAGIAIIMGDVSDARDRKHKFFDPASINPKYNVDDLDILEDLIAEDAAALFAPIKDRLFAVLLGNHHSPGFTRRMLRNLGLQKPELDVGDRCMVRLNVTDPDEVSTGRRSFIVFAQHVDSVGRKPGSQLNGELDNLISFDADAYLFAHSHRVTDYLQPQWSIPSRGKLKPVIRNKLLLNAGSFVDAPQGVNAYPDAKGLPLQNDRLKYIEVVREWNTARSVWQLSAYAENWRLGVEPEYRRARRGVVEA